MKLYLIITIIVVLCLGILTVTFYETGLFTLSSDSTTLTPFQVALSDPDSYEFSKVNGSIIGVMAFHGGAIDKGTEQIARCVLTNANKSYYIFSARRSSGNWDLHVESDEILPTDSENIYNFIYGVNTAISIHGHTRDNKIYVGGLNLTLRQKIAQELNKVFPGRVIYDTKKTPSDLRGISSNNIVNKPLYKGVQIELPANLRPQDNQYDFAVSTSPGLDVCNAIVAAIK